MKHVRIAVLLCTATLFAAGCAGKLGGREVWVSSPPGSALEMQEKNIEMLTRYLDMMESRVAELRSLPESEDPLLREIQANDLTGANLRMELLELLLDHSRYVREKLLDAQADPGRKKEILHEYRQQRRALMRKVDAIDEQQDRQERRRMELGEKLVEEALQ